MVNGPGYLLRYRQGDGAWQETPLIADIIIGRSLECDITVIDEKVSRRHARLAQKSDGIWLTDLGSSNGTRIGSQTIPPQVPQHLNIDQPFFIGQITFSVIVPIVMTEDASSDQGMSTEKILSEYHLWYRHAKEPWQQYPFRTDIVIGRASDCDLSLDDGNLSRHHAHLEITPQGLSLTDLGSQNGTRINDLNIPAKVPQLLPFGKPFSMSSFTFIVNLPGAPPPEGEATVAAPPPVHAPVFQSPAPPPFSPRHPTAPPRPHISVPQVPIPPPVYSPNFQPPPPSFMPSPPQKGYPVPIPSIQPPPRQIYPPTPPRKKGPGLWLFFSIGGLVVFLCIIAGVLVWFFMPVNPQKPDFSATQYAIQQTQLIFAETPVVPPEQTPVPPGEASPIPENIPTVSPSDTQTWLVMVYGDADDSVLEAGMFIDLDEAELVGSSDRVQIVWQLDRFNGASTIDGDWTSTKRFYVTHDEELGHIGSQEISDLGEANMSNPNTLVDFILWAITTYPADKYVLIMSNHGSGWPGGWSDDDPVADGTMWLNQIDDALGYIIDQTGIGQFEMIGFDACLMAQLEVFSMIAPYARFGVASEETEPVLGWPYGSFLRQLVDNPSMNGADLSAAVVGAYITEDIIITSDDYRNSYTQGSDMEGASADQVAASELSEATMTAVDLSALPSVIDSLNNLTNAMQGIDQKAVAEARTYAQSYENVFSEDLPPPYLDLGNFSRLVSERGGSPEVVAAVDGLSAAISQAVIVEKHGAARPGSTGFSIYFPNSDLWQFTYNNDKGVIYTSIAKRFANDSLWDDFLQFHYTGTPF